MRRLFLTALMLTFVVSTTALATAAQAAVVNVGGIRQAMPQYDRGSDAGLALLPGTTSAEVTSTGASVVKDPSDACNVDAPLAAELSGSTTGLLCSHGGPVIGENETFALVWDPNPYYDYAATDQEQFLRDVADGSGTLTSPYAVTSQYGGPDQTSGAFVRAANKSLYGGGWDDSTAYLPSNCPINGTYNYYLQRSGVYTNGQNNTECLTDGQLKSELASMIVEHQINNPTTLKSGYTPLVVLLLPPGVVTCFDSAGNLCSANSDATKAKAQFCSYHSQLNVGGDVIDYVVQPWVVQTGCDESDAPALPTGAVDPVQLATDMNARLVNPLSQAQIAAIVNPGLDGWYNNQDGTEINDNSCEMLGQPYDVVTVGNSKQNPYELQRDFNNAGVVSVNPFALACTPNVVLQPNFVMPSAVDEGDFIEFDGSKSYSSLLIPDDKFSWNFGDGNTAVGPSAVHKYLHGGTYTVTLTVTDRGDDQQQLAQTIQVFGDDGQTPPSATTPSAPSPGSGGGSAGGALLNARLQLLPQSLKSVLRSGIAVRVSSNKAANGIATVWITRAAAKRAHIKVGRAAAVRIGIGTVSSVTNGTVTLRLHLSRATAKKLAHLGHVKLTVRLALVASGNQQVAVDVAGQY